MESFNSAAVLGGAAVIAAGVVIALFQRISARMSNHDKAFARIETLLTGANGNNGLAGDVKALRQKSHHHGDLLHEVNGKFQVYDIRLEAIERRNGPDDRRQPA